MELAERRLEVDECHCFAIRKAARRISRLYDNLLQPTGLRITQFLILAVLAEVGSARVSELSERLDLERTAMGKTLGPLERDGLVRIAPSRTDGRARVVTLTREGRRAFLDARPLWQEAQYRLVALNGEQWIGALRSDLTRVKVDHDDGNADG
jgi:DNA-binding MarR family transcriptional regulator